MQQRGTSPWNSELELQLNGGRLPPRCHRLEPKYSTTYASNWPAAAAVKDTTPAAIPPGQHNAAAPSLVPNRAGRVTWSCCRHVSYGVLESKDQNRREYQRNSSRRVSNVLHCCHADTDAVVERVDYHQVGRGRGSVFRQLPGREAEQTAGRHLPGGEL